ncbi:MAG TPA: ATP-binding protein [Usitatibacter sp.]|nr:ATP-binding protein [Usitatibacter sp.]
MRPARWVSSSAGFVFLLAVASWAAAAPPVLAIDTALFLRSESAEPPPDSAPWRAQALPDNWKKSRPKAFGYGWYRLTFELSAKPEAPYAIYTPWMRTIGAVYVNGTEIGRTGAFGTPQLSPYPQVFVVPPNLLRAGENTLHVRLFVGDAWRGALAPLTVGEDTAVRPLYDKRYFVQITGAQLSSALSAALGIFMLMVWFRRRTESLYAYFGVGALGWAAMNALYLVRDPILNRDCLEFLLAACNGTSTVCLSLFALRYAGLRWPRIEKALWAWAAVQVALVFVESDAPWMMVLEKFLDYSRLALIAAWLMLLAHASRKRPGLERALVLIAVAFFGGTIIRDMIAGELLGELDSTYQPYRAIPMCIAIGWALVDRFVHSLNESERLNAELERRVAEKHAELELNYGRMNELERQRAVAAERQRIMSDMHDGVGGHLISTLSLVEQGDLTAAEVAAALRECLDDLRLTIDSLEPTEDDLLPVLGNLRYRLDERLKRQGVELDWRITEVPKLANMTPRNVLHVLRILQEAFTNVLKHAKASNVEVETGVDAAGEHVYIRVRDDGCGFAGDRAGHGFANMRRRAQVVGGALAIHSSPAGTTVSLSLPLQPIPHSGDGRAYSRDTAKAA